jgi:hypothetical protein
MGAFMTFQEERKPDVDAIPAGLMRGEWLLFIYAVMHTKKTYKKLEIADKVMNEIKSKVVKPLAVEEAI